MTVHVLTLCCTCAVPVLGPCSRCGPKADRPGGTASRSPPSSPTTSRPRRFRTMAPFTAPRSHLFSGCQQSSAATASERPQRRWGAVSPRLSRFYACVHVCLGGKRLFVLASCGRVPVLPHPPMLVKAWHYTRATAQRLLDDDDWCRSPDPHHHPHPNLNPKPAVPDSFLPHCFPRVRLQGAFGPTLRRRATPTRDRAPRGQAGPRGPRPARTARPLSSKTPASRWPGR